MTRQAGHCIRDERLQVQDSILLLKKVTRQAGQCSRDERFQVEDSILLLKKNIAARLPPQCIRDERLQIEDNILLSKYCCGKAGRTLHQAQQPAMKHSKRLSQGQAIRPARHMALHCGETTCNETL